MRAEAPRGVRDVLPPESDRWRAVIDEGVRLFRLYGYREIILPEMEYLEVFERGIGEGSDIVQKEMFTLQDKGGRSLALRPEATAGVVRAYIQHRLDRRGLPVKLFYLGAMFRHERPQAGRLRRFHQMGVELIGSPFPSADAEVILLCAAFLERVALKTRLLINSVGDDKCRPAYLQELRKYLEARKGKLCEDCRRRLAVSPLRVLDCKREGCREVVSGAPVISGYLCGECRRHHVELLHFLESCGVEYVEDERLVRGLDYYTRTVFEFHHPSLGAQSAVAAGGRYDDLVEEMGGSPTPAVGFSVGLERVMMAGSKVEKGEKGSVYVAAAGEETRLWAFRLAMELRRSGVAAEMDHLHRSLKAQMKDADRRGCTYTVIAGEEEMEEGLLTVRDMITGEQVKVKEEGLAGFFARKGVA